MEVLDAKEAVLIAGDNDIDLDFWKVAKFYFVEVV
jgi:hypothetical protein